MDWISEAAAAFGLGTVLEAPRAVPEAWSNQVFRIRTGTGSYVIKILAASTLPEIHAGIAVERAVLATSAVPMAEPVPDPDGHWLVTLSDGTTARCHRWVAGIPASSASTQPVRDIGRSVGVIHGLGIAAGDSSTLPPLDLDRWYAAVELAERFAFAGELRTATPLVERLAAQLRALIGARLPLLASHRDLDPKNAVIRPDGRVAILDWDYAGPIVPEGELLDASWSFCQASELGDFVRSYVDAGGPVRAIPALSIAAQQADLGWLLRNVERCVAADPAERALGQRLAPELIAALRRDSENRDRWAELLEKTLTSL